MSYVFSILFFLYIYFKYLNLLASAGQSSVAVLDHYVLLKDFWGSSDTDLIVLMDSFRIRAFKRVS